MSKHRVSPKAGWANESQLPRGPNGRCLCRWCGTEVPKGRRTFCGEPCIHEWKIRTNPGYVREQVAKRDKGICAACGLDTGKLERILGHLFRTLTYSSFWDKRRRRHLTVNDARRARQKARLEKIQSWYPWAFPKRFSIYYPRTLSPWQADHIVPVVEGGGECGLDNYRTLCTPCHKKATKELHGRLKKARQEAKSDG